MATANIKPTTYRYLIPDTESETSKIISASRKISGCIRFPDLFNIVLECALDCSGAQKGIIFSMEGGKPCVRSKASRERDDGIRIQALPKSLLYTLEQDDFPAAVIQHVIGTGKEVIINELKPPNSNFRNSINFPLHTRLLAFPIVNETVTIGIIYLESDGQQPPFSESIISMISMICDQAAISFQNGHHFDLLGEKVIKQMHRIRQIKKEIEMTDGARTDYLTFINDTIRSKLGDVIGFSNLIQSRVKNSQLNKETCLHLEHIQKSTQELSEFLENASVFSIPFAVEKSKLEGGLNLKLLIQSIYQSNRNSAAKRSVNLELNFKEPLPKMINSDRRVVNWILMTVISRTIKSSHRGDTIDLTVSATSKDLLIAIIRKQVRLNSKRELDQMPEETPSNQGGAKSEDSSPEMMEVAPPYPAFFDFIDLDIIKKAVDLLQGRFSTLSKPHISKLSISIPHDETLSDNSQADKRSLKKGKSPEKMPLLVAKELLRDFKVLQTTPIFKGGTLYRTVRKAKQSCEGYNSSYPEILNKIETAVFEDDKPTFNRLITKLLAIHSQETTSK